MCVLGGVEAMTRHTTTHDRFEAGCALCGRLGGHRRLDLALREALAHDRRDDVRCIVGVYDVMARVGAPEKWTADGRVVERRREDDR